MSNITKADVERAIRESANIPSVAQIAAALGTSSATIRPLLEELRQEGRVKRMEARETA